MQKKLFGLFTMGLGLGVIIAAFLVEAAWLGLCFGSVIVGIVLLLFASHLLLAPFFFLFAGGAALLAAGYSLMQE